MKLFLYLSIVIVLLSTATIMIDAQKECHSHEECPPGMKCIPVSPYHGICSPYWRSGKEHKWSKEPKEPREPRERKERKSYTYNDEENDRK